jgi:hypothetical protein
MTNENPTTSENKEADASIVLHADRIETELKRISKLIDNEVKTTVESRDLHDFIQDELLPLVGLLVSDVKNLAVVVMEHEQSLADIEMNELDTQISKEHADELLEHLEECNALLQQLFEQSKIAGTPLTPLEARIAKGKALIEFIKSATISDEDDDEDEEETKPN